MKIRLKILLCLLATAVLMTGLLVPGSSSAEIPAVRDGIVTDGAVIAVLRDGTVRLIENDGLKMQPSFLCIPLTGYENWSNITQVALCGYAMAGLREDGTVVAIGEEEYVDELQTWEHVVQLYDFLGDYDMIAGLREDGTVTIVGYDPFERYRIGDENLSFYEMVESWQNIRELNIGVSYAGAYAAAIHRDGTVSCSAICDTVWSDNAKNIVGLDCSGWDVIALRDDGTCVVNGGDSRYRKITDTWTDLKQVGCGGELFVGLLREGRFVATREDLSEEFYALRDIDRFECGIHYSIIAYRRDGTVEVFENVREPGNKEVRKWTDIEKILGIYPAVVGLKTDGTLVSTAGEFSWN